MVTVICFDQQLVDFFSYLDEFENYKVSKCTQYLGKI